MIDKSDVIAAACALVRTGEPERARAIIRQDYPFDIGSRGCQQRPRGIIIALATHRQGAMLWHNTTNEQRQRLKIHQWIAARQGSA